MSTRPVWLQESQHVTLDPSRITEGCAMRPEHTWLGQIDAFPSQVILSILKVYNINIDNAVGKAEALPNAKGKKEILTEVR